MKHCISVFAMLLVAAWMKLFAQMPDLKLEDFVEGLNQPLGIENAGDMRLFILEKAGTIRIVDNQGEIFPNAFLDITDRVNSEGDEQGMLGLAFHPDFQQNGYFYVSYTDMDDNIQISRFSVNPNFPNKAQKHSEVQMLNVLHPFTNHNAGCLKFGPDGYLYISMGDGGNAGDPFMLAQNPQVLLGKMLRISVDNLSGTATYAIPVTNPFANTIGAEQKEIWAMGLRNPWRFSFDRKTGDLWIGDVGQDEWEEVNLQLASSQGGENYGWSCYEGTHLFHPGNLNCPLVSDITWPVIEYSHGGGNCTVIGGFVYRGHDFPDFKGKYFYADYCSGEIHMAWKENGQWHDVNPFNAEPFEISTFGENAHGELFLADIVEGEIYKLVDSSEVLAPRLASFGLPASLYPNPSGGIFSVEWYSEQNGDATIEVENIAGQRMLSTTLRAEKGENSYTYSGPALASGHYVFTITTTDGQRSKQPFIIE